MDRRLRTAAVLCALTGISGCRGTTALDSRRQDAHASLELSERALGLTRQLPHKYAQGCLEILREMHVNPCPPLVPEGEMETIAWGDSLDVMSSTLSSINGRDIDAHGGHWTIEVAGHERGRKALADQMRATWAKTPSQCRFLDLEGQRVETCRVPPYPDGGYYGNHIAYAWQRGEFAYNVTLHDYANEPRLRLMMASLILRETSSLPRPRFETATLRRCADGAVTAGRGRDARERHPPIVSSGRIILNCQTPASLVAMVYVQFENGLGHSHWAVGENGTVVSGGPSWIWSDRYTVDATSKAEASTPLMAGPMLQTLLEDRFKLKVHYETRDVPVYELTRMDDWYQKLQRIAAAERCTSPDVARDHFEPRPPVAGERWCAREISSPSTALRLNVEGATIAELAKFLGAQPFIARRITDRTGYPGRYDFRLASAPRLDGNPMPADAARGELFKALDDKFGLKLAPAKGPARFLIVDRVEQPAAR